MINCNSCHLPKGSPELTNENDGGVAPSFRHSAERLRHDWVRVLLDNPTHLIHGTKMPNVYSLTSKGDRACDLLFQAFQFELRWDEEWQALYNSEDEAKRKRALTILAERQMDALTDYLLYHYENRSDEPPMRKPVETWPKNKTVLPGKGR